jgi:hypothetical protein
MSLSSLFHVISPLIKKTISECRHNIKRVFEILCSLHMTVFGVAEVIL